MTLFTEKGQRTEAWQVVSKSFHFKMSLASIKSHSKPLIKRSKSEGPKGKDTKYDEATNAFAELILRPQRPETVTEKVDKENNKSV